MVPTLPLESNNRAGNHGNDTPHQPTFIFLFTNMSDHIIVISDKHTKLTKPSACLLFIIKFEGLAKETEKWDGAGRWS